MQILRKPLIDRLKAFAIPSVGVANISINPDRIGETPVTS